MRKLMFGLWFAPSLAWAATGSIEVQVSKAPGEIVLDGFPTGKNAPAVLDNVPTGDHVIELEYGCLAGKAEVTVAQDETAVAALVMDNRGGQGTLRLRGLPNAAQVLIDGAPVDNASEGVQLACGARHVEIEAPGFQHHEEMAAITTGKWTTLDLALDEISMEVTPPQRPAADDLDLDGPDPYDDGPDGYSGYDELDELDEGDEDDDRGRGRDRDRDEDDDPGRYDALDDLDEGGGDFDGFDEGGGDLRDLEDEDEGDIDDVDDYDELDDLDGSSKPRKDPRDKKDGPDIPVRGLAVAGGGVVALGGIVLGAANTGPYLENKSTHDQLVRAGRSQSEAALQLEVLMEEDRKMMALGYGVAVVGAAGAAAGFFLLPARDADVVVTPTFNGVSLSGRF
ncbi:MAG: hypothetical protein H6739_39180 [Alphaproteobacteria bacterium]|nr:hypothetical protein [Alphaproteobacteria bacterium]